MEMNRPFSADGFRTAVVSLLMSLSLVACGKSGDSAPPLTAANQTLMGQYESIRAALATDDLRGTKKAAAAMAESLKTVTPPSPLSQSADAIANAPALDRARQAFKAMSTQAITMTKGVKGYYVVNCPMTPNGDWVQTTQTIDNPYMGKIMHDCGVVKK